MDLSLRGLLNNLTFVGVIFHEIGHLLFCRFCGVKIFEVCYFRFGNPSGYVIHEQPKYFIHSFLVTIGPFISGIIISALSYTFSHYLEESLASKIVMIWFGGSVALHSFPSETDANDLWKDTNKHISNNLFAVIGYPFVLLIWLANWLSVFWIDLIYAILLYVFVSNLLN
nr:metalloprotease family protein [uncultured Draconibacterium sp.]